MKLISYIRASTDRQVEIGLGLEVQATANAAWAKRMGHQIVATCADEGLSGTMDVDGREGLAEALSLLRARKADGIVVANLDRLARKLSVQEGILGYVWEAGGRVFSVDEDGEIMEDDPDDPMRTAIRQMRGVFHQLDRSTIAKRLRDGRKAKAAAGGYAFGAPPLGYRAEQRALVPVEGEQATLKRIVELRMGGESLRSIGAVLLDEGLLPKRGGCWHPHTLARICKRLEANPPDPTKTP